MKSIRFARSCVLILALWVLASAASVQAESASMYGLDFPVEEYAEISPGAVKVTVLGESFVAHPDDVPNRVAQKYFATQIHSRRFSQEQIQKFMESAAAAKNSKMASMALANLVARQDLNHTKLEQSLIEVLALPGASQIAKEFAPVLVSLNGPNLSPLFTVFVFVAEYNLKWAKDNLQVVVQKHKDQLLSYIREQFDKSIIERQYTRAERLMHIAMSLFGDEEPVYKEFVEISKRIQQLKEAAQNNQVRVMHSLVELFRTNQRLEKLLGAPLLESLHASVEKEIKSGDPQNALSILSRMNFDSRTPTTHELTRKAIAKLPLFSSSFNDPLVSNYLSKLSEVDQNVRQSYFNYLLREIRQGIKASRWLRADNSLRRLIQIRPDPNPQNDELRFEIALSMVKVGLVTEATTQIENMRTGLSLGKRLALIFSGYYVSRGVLWCSILLLILIPLVLYVRERIRLLRKIESGATRTATKRPAPSSHLKSRPVSGEGEEEISGGFTYSTIRRGLSPRMYEYVGLLRMFELGPEASVKMIKVAYRSAIKEVHPDLHPNPTAEQSQRFLDLTNAYERIVELRELLGLIDE